MYIRRSSRLCPDLLPTYITLCVLDLDPNDVHFPAVITKEGLKSIVGVCGGAGRETEHPIHPMCLRLIRSLRGPTWRHKLEGCLQP